MLVRFQLKRDTAADWASCNPVLLESELGHETDTDKLKIGNGVDDWNSLPYLQTSGGGGGGVNPDLTNVADGSLIYYNAAQGAFVVDSNITVSGIVDGGNF